MPSDRAPTFAERLRRHRRAAGLTQDALAERAGVSTRAISDLERGVKAHPHRETVRLLSEGLGLSSAERTALLAAVRRPPTSASPARQPRLAESALPQPRTPLVGRDDDLARIGALVRRDDVALATVTGPGGVGKTRLALEAARQAQPAFPDGVWFVDLTPVTEAALVPAAIATALGLPEQPGRSRLATLQQALAGRRVLLVLDNCEHLLAAGPDLARLLASAPELTILATSRTRLGLRGEREWPLAPLPVADLARLPPLPDLATIASIQLFVARVQAFKPDFGLTAANAPAVAGICARLDGLPLALELAAARIKLLPPAALLARLERRLPLLTGGARDLPARQRTLRDAIAWSYDLLSREEQQLFVRLAVFVGDWTIEAAEAVVNPEGSLDVFGGLASLVDKSLVRQIEQPNGDVRFAMLETVREFAVDRLAASGEDMAARHAHAAYLLALAERLSDQLWIATEPRLLDALERELPNARAALTWLAQQGEDELCLRLAIAYGWLWFVRSYLTEGRRWLDPTQTPSPTVPPTLRAHALMWASDIALRQNDFTAARAMAAASIAQLRETGERSRWLVAALINHASALPHWWSAGFGEEAAAGAELEEALTLARDLDATLLVAVALENLAKLAINEGNPTRAEALLAEAIALQAQLPAAWGTPFAEQLLGVIAYERHDWRAAMQHFRACLDAAWTHADFSFVYAGLLGVSIVAAAQNELEAGAQLIGAADAITERAGARLILWVEAPLAMTTTRLAERLGERDFGVIRAQGAAWSTAEAVAVARTVADRLIATGPAPVGSVDHP